MVTEQAAARRSLRRRVAADSLATACGSVPVMFGVSRWVFTLFVFALETGCGARHTNTAAPAIAAVRPAVAVEPVYRFASLGVTDFMMHRGLEAGRVGIITDGAPGRAIVNPDGSVEVAAPGTSEHLMGGVPVPARLGGGFVFWSDVLYHARSFTAPLTPVTSLPTNAIGVEFGPNYLLLLTSGSPRRAFALDPPRRLPLSPKGVIEVLATDDGRALALDATGRALSSTDAGKSWKDATSLLGTSVAGLREEGNEIALAVAGGGAWLQPDGQFTRRAFAGEKRAWRPPVKDAERLRRAFSDGLPLSGMRAWVGEGRGTLIVDLHTGSASAIKEVGPEGSSCMPVSLDDEGLIVCVNHGSKPITTVISRALTGAPVIEKTFPGSPQFLAGHTLSILASCSGAPAEGAACVRRSVGVWTELNVSPALLGVWQPLFWLPRENGGIAAIVGERDVREGEPKVALLDLETNRVTPWNTTTTHVTPSRPGSSLSVLADGSVRGFSTTGSIAVDAQGQVTLGAREFVVVVGAGAHALARDVDEHLWQTSDYGAHWAEIARPPFDSAPEGVSVKVNPRPSGRATWMECSANGCVLEHSSGTGMWLRLGWPEDPPSSKDAPPIAIGKQVLSAPQIPEPDLPKLRCAARRDGPLRATVAPRRSTDPEASEQWLDVLGGKRALARRGSRSFVNVAYRDVFSADNDYMSAGLRAAVHLRTENGAASTAQHGSKTALDLLFVEPLELGGRIRQISASMPDGSTKSQADAGAARGFDGDQLEGAARPLLGSEPGRAGGVLLINDTLSLLALSRGQIQAIRPGCKASSGYVDVRGQRFVACAKANASTRIETLTAPPKEVLRTPPAEHFRDREIPGLRFFAPGERALVNPDAIAVAGDGKLAVLRLPAGDEPPTVDNPAWLLSGDAPPVELAPWSTLDVATSSGCNGGDGYRAIVQTGKAWLDVSGASRTRSAGMTALVRWSAERVCLEAVEVGFGSVESEQSRPLHVSAVARFVGARPEAAFIGTESSVMVREPASCTLERR